MARSTGGSPRELRVRPAPSQPTSMRSGLRNSDSLDKDDLPSLPPSKRRRISPSSQIPSSRVYVLATKPELVIAGIQPHQWPLLSLEAGTNGKEASTATQDEPRHSDGIVRLQLKRRAVHEESYAEVNSEDGESSYSDHAAHARKAPARRGRPRRASPKQNGTAPKLTTTRASREPSAQSQTLETIEEGLLNVSAASRVDSRAPSAGASGVISTTEQIPKSQEVKDPDDLPELLPGPFMSRQPTPEAFEDAAWKLYHEKFVPITAHKAFTDLLSSHPPSERSTDTLFRLAENAQKALAAWQDEYLVLEKKTAPAQNPPKKLATGGRVPMDDALYDIQMQFELHGHMLGVEGMTWPDSQRGHGHFSGIHYEAPAATTYAALTALATETGDGRRSRRRGADAKLTDGVQISDDAGQGNKRSRKPVRRFDAGDNSGEGRKRRRGIDDDGESDSETPVVEDEPGPRKRARGTRLHIQEDASADSGESDRATSAAPSAVASTRGQSTRGRGGRGRGGRGRAAARASPAVTHSAMAAALPQSGTLANGSSFNVITTAEPRAKKPVSEKRSQSMTKWWAERKQKADEEKARQLAQNGGSASDARKGAPAAASSRKKQKTTAPSSVEFEMRQDTYPLTGSRDYRETLAPPAPGQQAPPGYMMPQSQSQAPPPPPPPPSHHETGYENGYSHQYRPPPLPPGTLLPPISLSTAGPPLHHPSSQQHPGPHQHAMYHQHPQLPPMHHPYYGSHDGGHPQGPPPPGHGQPPPPSGAGQDPYSNFSIMNGRQHH